MKAYATEEKESVIFSSREIDILNVNPWTQLSTTLEEANVTNRNYFKDNRY